MSDLLEPAHSPLGPSSSERWINCPGSVLATRGMPDTDSEYSIEGTAAHTLSEIARIENKPVQKYLGDHVPVKLVNGKTRAIEVTQEMVDGVQEFIDYVEVMPGDAFFEVRLRYDEYVPPVLDNEGNVLEPGGYGTGDDLRVTDGWSDVTDFKFGKGIKVYAKRNTQLMLYALGLYLRHRHLYDFQGFRLHIAQPRINHIDMWEITVEDLLKWAEEVVKPAAILARSPGAPFKAGDWCQFCKIRETCDTRTAHITNTVLDHFEDLTASEVAKLKPPVKLKNINTMSNEDVGAIGHFIGQIRSWCKDVENYIITCISQGIEVPSPIGPWKMVEGRSNRTFAGEPAEVEAKLYALKGPDDKQLVTEDKLYKKEMVGPPAIEKIIGKKHPIMKPPAQLCGKELGEEKFCARLQEHTGKCNVKPDKNQETGGIVYKPPGKPKLAPGNDPRQSLSVDVLKHFEDLTTDEEEDD